jgi:hypothetical protein
MTIMNFYTHFAKAFTPDFSKVRELQLRMIKPIRPQLLRCDLSRRGLSPMKPEPRACYFSLMWIMAQTRAPSREPIARLLLKV